MMSMVSWSLTGCPRDRASTAWAPNWARSLNYRHMHHTVIQLQSVIYFANAAVTADSSHMTVSSSASWSRFNPSSNFVNGHVSTTWFTVCCWPQSQEGLDRSGKWFIRDIWLGRSKPGCRIVGSVTVVWLTTEADDQSSFHCVTGAMINVDS